MSANQDRSLDLRRHQAWLEAHLALGRLEVQQGSQLGWRERSKFITDYIEDQVGRLPDEIESTKPTSNNGGEKEHG